MKCLRKLDNNILELKRLELQDCGRERESQLKLRELEVREKELSVQLKIKELEKAVVTPVKSPEATTFDVSKHIRFVPQFQEKVDKYFLHFEKVATSLAWPKEVCIKGVGRGVRMVRTNPPFRSRFLKKLNITPHLTALELSGSYFPTGTLYYS